MRTTIEISEEHHRALAALARERGLRGFSPIVEEALDSYLRDLSAEETDFLLSLEGSISEAEAREVRSRIDAARDVWRAS
jgi:hypothetical protein